ncbi:MAG: hypothetical protein AAF739_01910 [Pseudomonadota bacterium]
MSKALNALVFLRQLWEIRAIRPHFDETFYLRRYGDVAEAGADPVIHYVRYGASEGRNPTPHFHTRYYQRQYEDRLRGGTNPFFHYVTAGKKEGLFALRADEFFSESAADGDARAIDHQARPSLATVLQPHVAAQAQDFGGFDFESVKLFRQSALPPDLKPIAAEDVEREVDEQFVAKALEALPGKVLSLDIWDTILRRSCHPDETKLRASRLLWLTAQSGQAKSKSLHPVDVFQLRRACEHAVADAAHEYRFRDAVPMWLDLLGLEKGELAEAVHQNEIAIERSCTSVDPTIAALIERHDGEVIAVSDFYLGADALQCLLESKGVTGIRKVYASCDVLATKRQGDLFDHVLKAEDRAPDEFVHIGDRQGADVDKPRAKGLNALHYEVPREVGRADRMGQCLDAHLRGDFSLHANHLLGLIGGTDRDTNDGLPATALAIPIVGFVLQVIEDAVRNGVAEIFFFTREGVFFRRIYEAMCRADVYDRGHYPTGKLLEVSRRATFAASLNGLSTDELMRLWSQYSTQSLRALAVSLNLDADAWAAPASAHGLDLDTPIQYPWRDDRVQAFLKDQTVKNPAVASIARQRSDLLAYLENAGFRPSDEVDRLVVDIGWRGTIHDNIASLCTGRVHGCYLALEHFLNPQPANTSKTGYLSDRNGPDDDYSIPEHAAIEFILNAEGGSVVGYENAQAIRETFASEERVIGDNVLPLQTQIEAAADLIIAYVKDHGLIASDLRQLSRSIIDQYIGEPSHDVANAFIALEHNETFGTGETDAMDASHTELAALDDKAGADFHASMGDVMNGLRWIGAHKQAGPVHDFLKNRSTQQRIETPLRIAAPALLPRARIGTDQICVFAPPPLEGSGGHRTIYNLCRRLSSAGFDVHLMNDGPGEEAANDWQVQVIAGAGLKLHNSWETTVVPAAAIATIDYSAFYVDQTHAQSKGFYFIQDYEAMFNPVSDGYLRGQRSYALGLHSITIGRWLTHVLRTQYGAIAASAGLGVDHTIYKPLDASEHSAPGYRPKTVGFLYQPEKFRRAPQLCIDALAEVKRRLPEVEIITYGSPAQPKLPFEAAHRGLINDLQDVNRLYNECRVGLCISATNPSRIPFEMMAAGCVPVDIYSYNNLFDYGAGTGFLAYQSPQSLADAMCQLLENDTLWAERSAEGRRYVAPRSMQWEADVAVNVVREVLERGALSDLPYPEPLYTDPAVVSEFCEGNAVEAYVAWQLAQAQR